MLDSLNGTKRKWDKNCFHQTHELFQKRSTLGPLIGHVSYEGHICQSGPQLGRGTNFYPQ